MDEVRLCRLCITSCNEFKSLYDNNGQVSQVYEIAVKYFDPTLLNPGKNHASRLLCLECWKHICDFYSYQQSIICAQSQLENVKPFISVVKLNQMLPTADRNEVTYDEPYSVFDIIHLDHSTKSKPSQLALKDSVTGTVRRDENLNNCEEIYSVKRRKLKNDVPLCKGDWKCVECKETFANDILLSKHFQSEHPNQEWNTKSGDCKFNNRVAPQRQFHSEMDDNSYNCECCSASFTKYLSLRKHILTEHTTEALMKYTSNFNSKSFKKPIIYNVKLDEDSTAELSPVHNSREEDNDLQENISIDSIDIDEIYEIFKESPEKEVPCSSLQRSNLDINKKEDLLLKTNIDSNRLDESNSCEKHNPSDNDNLIAKLKGDLECPNCKEQFAFYSLLNEHFIREHPSDECHIVCCQSKFFKINKFVTHLGSHARKDKNAYSCKMCGASFTQYGSLRRHIRSKHAVQSLLKWLCDYCNETFKTRSSLEYHKKMVHSKDKANNYIKEIEHSEDEQSVEIQENIYCSSVVAKDNDDLYEVFHKKEEQLVYDPNETPNSCNTSSDHIQQPPLEIIDIKEEICISSDNESVSNYPDNVTNVVNASYYDAEQNLLEYDDFIAKWMGDLKCPKCRQMFPNFFALDNHFHNEHQIKNGCYIICCQTGLNDRRLIVEHLREHHKDPVGFRCDVCGKCFKSDRSLASHKRQVHIDKRSKYHLHLCYCKPTNDRVAKNDNNYDTVICCERKQKRLEDDAIIAKWSHELKCRLCEATFSYYSLMHAHFYYEHPGERCYIICCQRNFYRISDALEHIRIHLDPFAFKCELCNLPFAGRSSLSKHMRLIHGETSTNKFACDQCNKSFAHSFILTRHKNVCHTTQDG